ncbi:MAG TPA: triose-phosphate isomerase [Thermoanaerobaculia bacterium]|nr:triose-phosphate isomerase [Thermoanaerobaculia bacterium]
MNLFVANWKMNMTRAEARAYVRELSGFLGAGTPAVELVIAPPYTAIDAARDSVDKARWSLAAQDVSSETEGAFTGEISARMLADAGCRYVLVGHSERRYLFGEEETALQRKLARTREAGLTPIYCVGETQQERAAGLAAATLARQVEALAKDPADSPLVVAYEPVWAIGTGIAAEPADAASARVHLAELLSHRPKLRLLYGGSVAPENARRLLETARVDGFLIGAASLKASTFAAIAGLVKRKT